MPVALVFAVQRPYWTPMKPSRREVLTYSGLFLLSAVAYFNICHHVKAPVEVFMPAWVPFLPWLAIPYLLQVIGSYFMVFAIRDKAIRRACWYGYFSSYTVTCLIWWFYPTVMYRPVASAAWWNFPFNVMASTDLPVSVLPAGHVLMPVLLCWGLAYDRPRWLRWLVPAELLGTIAIVTTWQHRPSDIVIGVAFAVVAGLMFGMGRRRAGNAAVTEELASAA